MAFMDFLFGKGERTQQVPRFSRTQQNALNSLLSGAQQQLPQGLDFLSSLLSPGMEDESIYERPAMRQFEEQIIPGIAERFTKNFGTGSSRSSAFGQQLGQAGARLSEALAAQRAGRGAQRSQLGLGALSQLQSLLGAGLTPQFETLLRPAQQGFLGQAAGLGLDYGLRSLLGV